MTARELGAQTWYLLEEVYAGLWATGALIYSSERKGFWTRLYGLVDKILPHLGQPALRRPRPLELEARARRFAELVAQGWHGGFEDHARAIEFLKPRGRRGSSCATSTGGRCRRSRTMSIDGRPARSSARRKCTSGRGRRRSFP